MNKLFFSSYTGIMDQCAGHQCAILPYSVIWIRECDTFGADMFSWGKRWTSDKYLKQIDMMIDYFIKASPKCRIMRFNSSLISGLSLHKLHVMDLQLIIGLGVEGWKIPINYTIGSPTDRKQSMRIVILTYFVPFITGAVFLYAEGPQFSRTSYVRLGIYTSLIYPSIDMTCLVITKLSWNLHLYCRTRYISVFRWISIHWEYSFDIGGTFQVIITHMSENSLERIKNMSIRNGSRPIQSYLVSTYGSVVTSWRNDANVYCI